MTTVSHGDTIRRADCCQGLSCLVGHMGGTETVCCEEGGSPCEHDTDCCGTMACTNSSQVTAWPSCRRKYRSMPRRKASLPISVWIMRTTSAPFSYTVAV